MFVGPLQAVPCTAPRRSGHRSRIPCAISVRRAAARCFCKGGTSTRWLTSPPATIDGRLVCRARETRPPSLRAERDGAVGRPKARGLKWGWPTMRRSSARQRFKFALATREPSPDARRQQLESGVFTYLGPLNFSGAVADLAAFGAAIHDSERTESWQTLPNPIPAGVQRAVRLRAACPGQRTAARSLSAGTRGAAQSAPRRRRAPRQRRLRANDSVLITFPYGPSNERSRWFWLMP